MLTEELSKNIDAKWAACWPTNSLKPLVLLDLISYLLFIKKLEDRQLFTEMPAPKQGSHYFNAIEKKELSWSTFKDIDAQNMPGLFTKEKGIFYQLNNYGNTNLKYSLFVKEPLLLTPTARILGNMVEIIKVMESQDAVTRATIFEYLLNKSEIIGQNGQVFAPDNVVKLMVAIMQPTPEDFIGDPSVANGSFLVDCKKYISGNSDTNSNHKTDVFTDRLRGMECDPIHLRIAAMNMILHGIEDPQLEGLNVLDNSNVNLRQQPTLVLSNLFFKSPEVKIVAGENTLQTKNPRPEINLLNLIVKNLKRGGRAAVIIRDLLLSENSQDIKMIRQQIIDEHKLEAVIFLPAEPDSLFSGACIIVFTKSEVETTDKVWFYKMDSLNSIGETSSEIENQRFRPGPVEDPYTYTSEALRHWQLKKSETGEGQTDNRFYVPVDEIKNKNYSLSFRQYGRVKEDDNSHLKPVRENRKTIILRERAKRKRKILRLSLLSVCLAAVAVYILYFKDKYPISFYAATKYERPLAPDSSAKNNKNLPARDPILAQVARKVASEDQYTVMTKAYFYNLPDENTRRNSYMSHTNNVLHSIDEKNGFIYVIYTNHHGQITKGWLNKKDLKAIQN